MTRSRDARAADVRRLLVASRALHASRSTLAPRIAADTGLTLAGVELGFESLERDASAADLSALLDAAGDARHVHVVLSANVFVAPLRAIALARAAGAVVTVRPSPRDPTLARALLELARDPDVTLLEERDVAQIPATRIDVYGRDGTIAAVRARARGGVGVRGHGPGLGVAVVGAAPLATAAGSVAVDVAAFDQRGCLSPRVVLVVGGLPRAEAFAEELHAALRTLGARVPRGTLLATEDREASRWRDAVTFAGRLLAGVDHAVAVLPSVLPAAIPPPGRHVLVVPVSPAGGVAAAMAPFARHVVAVGSDDPDVPAPSHARRSPLGAMQRPPLDGPVDRRRAL
jgi:hypothetical protein